jgi:hypothetical protein
MRFVAGVMGLAAPMLGALLLAASPAAAATADGDGAKTIAALKAKIAQTRQRIERVRDYDQIENLESIYSYYLDKDLWDQLSDLFARGGSMELAQRGVYIGQDHVRAFLHEFGGPEGPKANRLGNHLNVQPVITVSPDGQSAQVRIRLLQMMGQAGRNASWGGGVYENQLVKEDGVWKFKVDHVYNTFTANYDGAWAKQTRSFLPGPNKNVPPDTPPSLVFQAYPKIYDLPMHYKNPVTGE